LFSQGSCEVFPGELGAVGVEVVEGVATGEEMPMGSEGGEFRAGNATVAVPAVIPPTTNKLVMIVGIDE
jgi:hypothetical protein